MTTTTVRRPPDAILEDMRAVIDGAADRSLTDAEVTSYEGLEQELAATNRDAQVRARHTAYETPVRDDLHVDAAEQAGAERRNLLAYTPEALQAIQEAVNGRVQGRFEAGMTRERLEQLRNATLTTGDLGQPASWGSNVTAGPRILHQVAGVPEQPIEAVLAEFPELTIPSASASVGEGVTLTEYSSADAGTVTLGRFGRWTDLSSESMFGTSTSPVVGMHQLAIAKDLDDVLITAAETAAGTPVAFDADVPAALRTAVATVLDAVALEDPAQLVILAHPDNVALLEDVTPVGGATIGERFQRFSGALVYPSSAVETGHMTVAALQAAVRYFVARQLQTETDLAPKTDVTTLATSVIVGYGLGLVGDAFVQVDVVTP
jgi:hypothetical protein